MKISSVNEANSLGPFAALRTDEEHGAPDAKRSAPDAKRSVPDEERSARDEQILSR